MVRHYLLNDDGKTYREIDLFGGLRGPGPIEDVDLFAAFALQLADDARRNVGDDTISGYRISTKFIGIDSTPLFFPSATTPRPFETMVFGPDVTNVIARVSTWEQAHELHTCIVAMLRSLEADAGPLTRSYIELTSAAILRAIQEKN